MNPDLKNAATPDQQPGEFYDGLPQEVKDGLNIIEVENVKEACNYAFVTNPFLSKNIKVKDESSECEVC